MASPTTSVRDLRVGKSASEQLQHLALAVGELGKRVGLSRHGRRQPPPHPVEQPARDLGRQKRIARGHRPHRPNQFLGGHVLEDEAAGARAESVHDVVVEPKGGEDEHLVAGQPPRCLDAVEVRHPNVHQQHVGPERARGLHRLLAVLGLAHHLHLPGGLEHGAKAGPHQRLVVGDQDAQLAHRSKGSRARSE